MARKRPTTAEPASADSDGVPDSGRLERRARARLVDVAQRAGVSAGIASRVLNDPSVPVTAATRQRVLDAATELRYQPHAAARGLRRGSKVDSVALTVPDLANPVWARIVRGASRRAFARDVALLLIEDVAPAETDAAVAKLFLSRRIDALIVASYIPGHPLVARIDAEPLPYVFLHRRAPAGRSVTIDEAASSALAVSHLWSLGHRRIAHVSGPPGLSTVEERARGFKSAARRFEAAPVLAATLDEAGGYEALRTLRQRHGDVTAVTVGLLNQTTGLLAAAADLGVGVPDELSVICQDDFPPAEFMRPSLTRVRMPLEDLGAAGVDAVVDDNGRSTDDVRVPTAPVLVEGASTAPPTT